MSQELPEQQPKAEGRVAPYLSGEQTRMNLEKPQPQPQVTPRRTPTRAADEKFCHACARPIHMSATMCPGCGAQQQAPALYGQATPAAPAQRTTADQRHCYGCGTVIHMSAPTCPKCGAQQYGAAGGAVKSRITAALFAFFLGGFGAHKFYCGSTGWGIIYLIFFWTWVPALVALIEGIIYLTGSNTDEEFTRKYCS